MNREVDSPPQIFELEYYQHLFTIEERHWWTVGMRQIMAKVIEPYLVDRTNLEVLDAGCGTGYLMNFLAKYPIRMPMAGIDISEHALAFCRLRGQQKLALASASELPFAPGSFDLIMCIDTLQHLSPVGADDDALAGFSRLLRPNGLLFLRTNSASGHGKLRGVDENLYRRYRHKELVAKVVSAGLTVESASYVNMLPSVWAMTKELWSRSSRRIKSRPIGPGLAIRMPHSRLLNRFLVGLLRVEAWLIGGLGLTLPFGHSQILLAKKEAVS